MRLFSPALIIKAPLLALCGLLLLAAPVAEAQGIYKWSILAGGTGGPGSADGAGSDAQFDHPGGVAMDGSGNVYVADSYNNTIRKITSNGVVTTLAGFAGESGSADGVGSAARFDFPTGMAVDALGNVYVADCHNNTIRKITSDGTVSTLAGTAQNSGHANGTGKAARFNHPDGVAVDAAGNVYVADTYNHTIRKITGAGVVSTLAGAARVSGLADGAGSRARFSHPTAVAVDARGNLYVADSDNQIIRKITSAGVVSTLAGRSGAYGNADGPAGKAHFGYCVGVAVDGAGNVYVADGGNYSIRKISSDGTTVSTLAGGGLGYADGTGSAARFSFARGIAADASGNVCVADTDSATIRRITSAGEVSTLAGRANGVGAADGAVSAAAFYYPTSVAVDGSGDLYVADSFNCVVRRISASGEVSTFAGAAGVLGSDDGPRSGARFSVPQGIAVDGSGNVYVADTFNFTIRKISSDGLVSTLAGLAGSQGSADGAGSAARFYSPKGLAVDAEGNVYVADSDNHTIRKITSAGVVSTLAGRAGAVGYTDGTGSSARFISPSGVAVDGSGNVYVAQSSSLRKITSMGVVSTVRTVPGSLTGIAVDGDGTLYFTDSYNPTIRRITSAGVLSTIGGTAYKAGNAPGFEEAARFRSPQGIAVGPYGRLYVAGGLNHNIVFGTAEVQATVEQPAGIAVDHTAPAVNLGNVALAGVGVTRTFTVRNSGANDLFLFNTPITSAGQSAGLGDFAVTTPLGATTLAPGASTTFTVTFTPGEYGVRSAVVHLVSNDADQADFPILLLGTGADVTSPDTIVTAAPVALSNRSSASIAFTSSETGAAAPDGVSFEGQLDGATYAPVRSPVMLMNLAPGIHTYRVRALSSTGEPDPTPETVSWRVDTSAPVFTYVPSDVNAGTDVLATPVTWNPATATDDSGPVTITYSAASGSLFPPDRTPVTVTATDTVGNSATATFTVTLRLSQPLHTHFLAAGAAAPGHGSEGGPPEDAKLASFGEPAIDEDGTVAFLATWTAAGPPASRGSGIFTTTQSVAQVGGPAGKSGATFRTLSDPVVSEGQLAFLATIAIPSVIAGTNDASLYGLPAGVVGSVWRQRAGSLRPVAVANAIAPDETNARVWGGPTFKMFKAIAVAGGSIAIHGQVAGGVGALRTTAANDTGLWLEDETHWMTQVLRKGQLVGNRKIATLTTFAVGSGSPGQGRGWLTQTPGGPRVLALVTFTGADKAQAVLSAGFDDILIVAQNNPDSALPDIAGASFASYGMPAMNAAGTSAFLASLLVKPGGSATAANARGLFIDYDIGTYLKIARVTEPAGQTGSTFSLLKDPVLADDSAAAFPATLKPTAAVRGFAATTLWWKTRAGSLQLLAQGGPRPAGQPIPGLPIEAQWTAFPSLAIASERGPIFTGTLLAGKGGVTAATAHGVWATDYAGVTRLLFRTGIPDAIVAGKTLKSFTLLKTAVGSVGVTRSFNGVGQLVWLATFTDRTTALIQTDIP